MSVNKEVKGQLAKLLATENLFIEHRNVSTAAFDVEQRILFLPIWKNISSDVYDLLVGHEVGHALYTPSVPFKNDIPKSFINIVEDARIEKLIKRQYPGLTKNFFRGYNELHDRDFFEVKNVPSEKLSLIDRINLYFKIGLHAGFDTVKFSDDEQYYLDLVSKVETFEEAVEVARMIYEYSKQKDEQTQEVTSKGQSNQPSPGQSQEPSDQQNSDDGESDSQPQEQSEDSNQQESQTEPPQSSEGTQTQVPQTESVTDEAWTRNQEDLVDERARDYVYANVPKSNLDKIIIPFSELHEELCSFYANNEGDNWYANCFNNYQSFKRSTVKTVNYLVKEFECKKAASQYSRAAVSSTGVLNMSKLHTYKWNEDLFKKVTNVPDGKNHGLVMFIDWSGSMSDAMPDTVKQLYNLIWFCKKVNIPFRVYAFSDNRLSPYDYYENYDADLDIVIDRSEKDLYYCPDFRLLELFSSKMKSAVLEKQMKYIWYVANSFRHYYIDCPTRFCLSGTPLVETILTSRDVVSMFKKIERVEKVNMIFLTDGEASVPGKNRMSKYHKENYGRVRWNMDQLGYGKLVLTDPVTRYSVMMNDYSPRKTTKLFIEFLRNIVDCNVVGFRIIHGREISHFLALNDSDQELQVQKEWKKTKTACITDIGFKELYLLPIDKTLGAETEEIEVKSTTKGELTRAFKKHMGSKMSNKTILSKFILQVA